MGKKEEEEEKENRGKGRSVVGGNNISNSDEEIIHLCNTRITFIFQQSQIYAIAFACRFEIKKIKTLE